MSKSKGFRQITADIFNISVEKLEGLSKKDLEEKCEFVWSDKEIEEKIPSDFILPMNNSSFRQFIADQLGKIIKQKSSQFRINPGLADGSNSSSGAYTHEGRYRKR